MTDEQILILIDKIISKTKDHSLKWCCLRDNGSIMNEEPNYSILRTAFYMDDIQNGFYANYKNGFLFLVPIKNSNPFSRSDSALISIDESTQFDVSLRMQPSKNAYYTQLVTSISENSDINIQLRRLFTLVGESISDIDSFIDDFLNS